ncbi:prophage primase [Providencia rettgeri Dmel1]|nr:prophage primase [Providencia rettgeri Dmel1]
MNNQTHPNSSMAQTRTPSVSDIVKSANGRWGYILNNLGVTVPDNHKHGACPKCGGKDRSSF